MVKMTVVYTSPPFLVRVLSLSKEFWDVGSLL